MAARKKSTARKSSGSSKSKSSASKKSASKKKSSSSRQPSDALALLRQDHTKVQGLFDQFEKTRSEDRKSALAQEICQELTVHAQIEEEIFYPAAREALREEDLIDEATVEHQSAKDLIAQIEGSSAGSELFDAKVKVLGEYIKHHVKEEQNEMFAQIRKTKLDLKALGEQMQARKMELMEGGAAPRSSRSRGGGMSGSGRGSGGGGGSKKRAESEGIMATMARGMGIGGNS